MKELTVQKPDFDLDIEPFEKFKTLIIKSDQDAAYVGDRCQELKIHIKDQEDQRMKYTRPLDDLKKEMIRDERKITEPLKMILDILRRKVRIWLESQEDIRKAEAEKKRAAEIKKLEAEKQKNLQKAMETDDEKAGENVAEIETNLQRLEENPLHVDKAIRGDAGISSIAQYWKHEVVDAAKIPREFLLVDEKRLAKLARTEKGEAKVPGVKFFTITGLVQSK